MGNRGPCVAPAPTPTALMAVRATETAPQCIMRCPGDGFVYLRAAARMMCTYIRSVFNGTLLECCALISEVYLMGHF